ncbi:MAG: T9SS type A sorting domain-containing protein [Ignavibacteria bacterium]|nr:T9SS type A sorting domain-containing protein [Ignavibacteria bacterium]
MIKILRLIFLCVIVYLSAGAGIQQFGNIARLTDILIIANDNETSSDRIKTDLQQSNYNIDIISPDLVTPDILNDHRLIILSTGSNLFPCGNNYMRFILQNYIKAGGKVVVEGGQTGYVADILPEYPSFKSKVLKIDSWHGDNGGELRITDDNVNSSLALFPNILNHNMEIDYSGPADMDICLKSEFAVLFYKFVLHPDKGGVIVFPNMELPQVINLFFSYSNIRNKSDAKNLITNIVYNLIGLPVGISQNGEEIPSEFRLRQNFPNPFNPSTEINFDLRERGDVSIIIRNVLGQNVYSEFHKDMDAGFYSFQWKPQDLSSGMYFLTLDQNGTADVIRMHFVK